MVEYVFISKKVFLFKRRVDLEVLAETIVAEIFQQINKNIFFIVSYRHPNQSSEESEAYFSSLNDIVEKAANEKRRYIVLTGDFNARSTLFWENDTDTREEHLLSEIAIINNLEELVNKPTHTLDDGSHTCIDLIFTDQPLAFTNVEVIPRPERQSKHLVVTEKYILMSHVHRLVKRKYGNII